LVYLDEFSCRETFRHFLNLLHRAAFGNAALRFGKKLRIIPVLEKGAGGRWHYHAAVEPPPDIAPSEFRRMIEDCWQRTYWGYRDIRIREKADEGWIKYMLKKRQKSDFETWSYCIDWESLHNAIVDASRPLPIS
jgi:hypothetical protein